MLKNQIKNRNNIIGIPFIKNALKRDITSEDDVYDYGIGRFGLVLNELDDFLSSYPKDVRGQVRSNMVVLAISSYDPTSNLKETFFFSKTRCYQKK